MGSFEPSVTSVPAAPRTNVLAIVSLVTGILSLLISCLGLVPVIGWLALICVGPLSLAAIITGAIGIGKAKALDGKGKGMAVIGLVMGVVGLLTACIMPWASTALLAALGEGVGDVFTDINSQLQP